MSLDLMSTEEAIQRKLRGANWNLLSASQNINLFCNLKTKAFLCSTLRQTTLSLFVIPYVKKQPYWKFGQLSMVWVGLLRNFLCQKSKVSYCKNTFLSGGSFYFMRILILQKLVKLIDKIIYFGCKDFLNSGHFLIGCIQNRERN